MKRNTHTNMVFDNLGAKKTEGSIIRKPGSKKLYMLFYYHGRRIEKTTGLEDTPDNRDKVRRFLDRIIDRRDSGTLVFSEVFPGASEDEKKAFATLEGRVYSPLPKDIIFGQYLETWTQEIMSTFSSHTKRGDYLAIIDCWIRPHFSEKSFHEITQFELKKFIGTFKLKIGKNKGQKISRSRAANIICVLRTIVNDAVSQHHWDRFPDVFRDIDKEYPKTRPKIRGIFRFDELKLIVQAINPWYRPMVEFMVLTGMIHSEISGLQRSDIFPTYIQVQQSIVRKIESEDLKNGYRFRKLPITNRMRAILEEVLARTDSKYVFAEPDGSPYLREEFIKRYWKPAIDATGVPYRSPYSLRHSFAAWSLLVGIDPIRLVALMGHGSKKMIYDVYGKYAEDLEMDYWDILNYVGKDYVEVKTKKPLPFNQNNLGESFGESQGFWERNQLILQDI